MAAGFDPQLPALHQLRPAPTAGGGHLRQGGEGIEVGHQAGGGPDRGGPLPHPAAQRGEQLDFALGGSGSQLQDAPLASLEGRRHETLLVGQGLAADPVVGHGGGSGPAHCQEVAKAAVVLEPQVGVAAGAALARLLLGQPGVLVVELVAQAIEEGVHTVVDQASFAEAQGRGVEQVVAQFGRQGGQFRPGLAQGLQWRADALLEQPRQPRQPLQAIGQGHQVAGGGAAGSGPARQAL